MNNIPPNINNNPITQMHPADEQHHKLQNISVIAIVVALIMGLLYWWTTSGTKVAPITTESKTDYRAQVAELLRSTPSTMTQQQIDGIAAQLSKSKVTITDAEKQAIIKSLQSK